MAEYEVESKAAPQNEASLNSNREHLLNDALLPSDSYHNGMNF